MAQRPTTVNPSVRNARSTGRTAARSGSKVGSRAADEAQDVASAATDQAQEVASTAAEKGQEVVAVTSDQVREVTGTVKEQAAKVGGEALEQGRSLAEEARTQVEAQAQAQSRRLADTLSMIGDEVQALVEGRPDDAENLKPYVANAADAVYDAADRLYGLAADIDSRGMTGVLDDIQTFARRRPGAFLVGAAIAGFGIGRAVRANSADGDGAATGSPPVGALPPARRTTAARTTAARTTGSRPVATRAPGARVRTGGGAPAPADRIAARAAIARAARTR